MRKHPGPTPPELDPSPARVYDYLLGGAAHYAPDRALARKMLAVFPGLRAAARVNRQFLRRAVRFLAQQGIHQFLDLGAGIPAPGGVSDVARTFGDAHVVHVDMDSVAIALSEDAFKDNKDVAVIQADIREPEALLRSRELKGTLDLDQPVGVLMLATPHFLTDEDKPAALIERYRELIANGSYLAMTHATGDDLPVFADLAELCGDTVSFRNKAEVSELMHGFDLVEPGVTHSEQWRPDAEFGDPPLSSASYAAVGYKTGS